VRTRRERRRLCCRRQASAGPGMDEPAGPAARPQADKALQARARVARELIAAGPVSPIGISSSTTRWRLRKVATRSPFGRGSTRWREPMRSIANRSCAWRGQSTSFVRLSMTSRHGAPPSRFDGRAPVTGLSNLRRNKTISKPSVAGIRLVGVRAASAPRESRSPEAPVAARTPSRNPRG